MGLKMSTEKSTLDILNMKDPLLNINHKIFLEVVTNYPEITDEDEFLAICKMTALIKKKNVTEKGKPGIIYS